MKTKKTFLSVNFGCRVNAAETNQYSQILIDSGYTPDPNHPDLIFINTCSVTAKANIESLGKIRSLRRQFPNTKIIITGCADLKEIKDMSNVQMISNQEKERVLKKINGPYNQQIGDKFSHTNRYILKIQSGCTHFCSYCIVPQKRPYIWSLPIDKAVKIINQIIKNGYKEVIITGVNLDQYQYGFSTLIESILKNTSIPLISFGSIPVNCIDKKFIGLFKKYKTRISSFLHIPIQSGSDKILKLMNRPYTKKTIKKVIGACKREIENLKLGTDIIVGFPQENETDFKETTNLCEQVGFSKIHTFRFSPRQNTLAQKYYNTSSKIPKNIIKLRSQKIRQIITNDA